MMNTFTDVYAKTSAASAADFSPVLTPMAIGVAINRLQTLVEKFSLARNKKSTLVEMRPDFEALIKSVDLEFELATIYVEEQMTSLQPLLSKKLIETKRAERNLENIFAELERTGFSGISDLINLSKRWLENGISLDERFEIYQELAAYPQIGPLLAACRSAADAAAPVSNQIDFLEQSLNHCSTHRVKARYAWADILAGAGATARSQNVLLEAMSIQMGLPVEELKRSRRRRNERERERMRERSKVKKAE